MRANRRLSLDPAPSHGVLTLQTLCLLYPHASGPAGSSISTASQAYVSVDLGCGQPMVQQRVEPPHHWPRAGIRFVTNPSNISVDASGNDGGSKRAYFAASDKVTSNRQRPGEISVSSSSSHGNGWHSCSERVAARRQPAAPFADTNRQRPGASGTRAYLIPEPEPHSPEQVRSAESCFRASNQDQPAFVA